MGAWRRVAAAALGDAAFGNATGGCYGDAGAAGLAACVGTYCGRPLDDAGCLVTSDICGVSGEIAGGRRAGREERRGEREEGGKREGREAWKETRRSVGWGGRSAGEGWDR